MRICDLHTGRIQITRATKQLHTQWQQTHEHWRDSNQATFEQNYLQPLKPQVTLLLAAIQRLAEVLDAAERDCRDEQDVDSQ